MADTDSQRFQLEINHLKETINALRDELEKKQMEINRRLQSSKQASSEQIKQLEGTIDQMRIRLEEEHSARKTDVEKATRHLNEQLQQALRENETLTLQLGQTKNNG